MLEGDWFILVIIGGVLLVLGLIGILWGRHEERSYFESLADRPDMREFMSHWPVRPQAGALMTGGWIAVILGGMLLLVGLIIWIIT